MRKTIAIVGDVRYLFPEVMEVLERQDIRLLMLTKEPELTSERSIANRDKTIAEVEVISCEREGCWEADMIIIPQLPSPSLLNRIKEVATQKIVLGIYATKEHMERSNLIDLFPFSKVVQLQVNSKNESFSIFADDLEAKAVVQEIMDYKI